MQEEEDDFYTTCSRQQHDSRDLSQDLSQALKIKGHEHFSEFQS